MSRFKPTHYGDVAAAREAKRSLGAALAAPPAVAPERRPAAPVKSSRATALTLRGAVAAPGRLGIFASLLTTIFGMYLFLQLWNAPEVLYVLFRLTAKFIFGLWLMLALASLFTGHPMRFLRSPFAIPWLGLLAWMTLASVTGLYIGGSLDFLWEYALRTHLVPFLFCSIVLIPSHVTRLVYWMAAAMPVLLILCWRMGEIEDGRLGIPDTSLQNPNELAFAMLFVSAFVLMMLFSKSMVLKVVWLFVFAATAYYTLQTASRANFLTLLVVALALIVAAPGRIRFALGALLPIVGVIVMAAAPAETLDRLKLLLPSAVVSDELQARAAGSQEARLVLQKRALQLTLQNPVLGVGPRMFADAVDQMVREAEGRKSFWQEAHNTYLQISAETGIPGLLMYTYCVFLCLRLNYRSYRANMNRPDRATIAGQSMCLFLASVVYAFGTLFNSVAYLVYFSMLIGLTAANYLAIQDLDQREKAQDQAAATAA